MLISSGHCCLKLIYLHLSKFHLDSACSLFGLIFLSSFFFKIFRQELNINNNACSLTVWAEHKLISSWTSSVYFIFIFGHIIRNSTLPNSYFVMINIKIFILVETCFRALVHVICDRRLVTALQKAVNAETQNIYHNLPHALFFFCLEFIVIAISTF